MKQLLPGSLRNDPACPEHISPISKIQGLADVLLHQEDRNALSLDWNETDFLIGP